MSNIFSKVDAAKPGRSVFNLSWSKKFSAKMGQLIPVMHDEVIPGDVFEIGCEAVVRFLPLVAPPIHEVILKADYYFVPYRILYDTDKYGQTNLWERFITGGIDGKDTTARSALGVVNLNAGAVVEGSLLDYCGFPTGVSLSGVDVDAPFKFPGMAYFKIYNDYYRDPNLESEVDITGVAYNTPLKYANWDADYFTRALPFQQRGDMPGLPVTGVTSAVWPDPVGTNGINLDGSSDGYVPFNAGTKSVLDNNSVDLSSATSVSIVELRYATQLQKWQERNARVGYRYIEQLKGHWGVSPRDDRLQRPEYIGGVRQPVIFSEVLQTSKTDGSSYLGIMGGHGILAGSHYIGKYHVQEYGIIMCLMSVIPRPAYSQGIDRAWLRQSRYDFPFPEFMHLSEQAVYNEEIYLSAAKADNLDVFGYQGRYDELRSKRDQVAGALRSTLDYWHLGRIFGALPSLDSTFGHTDPASMTRIFANESTDNIVVHWGNKIKAIRPIPYTSIPGYMDHTYGGM